MNHALKTRDVLDFVQIRWANETDDFEIGDLFANAFIEYEEENFLNYWSREAKLTRIRDLEHVRDEGHVMVMELGYRIIGALTLFKPHAKSNSSWVKGAASIQTFALDPEYSKDYFVEVILERAEAFCLEQGFEFICAEKPLISADLLYVLEARGYLAQSNLAFCKSLNA